MRRYNIRDRMRMMEDIRRDELLNKTGFAHCIGLTRSHYYEALRDEYGITFRTITTAFEVFGYDYHFEIGGIRADTVKDIGKAIQKIICKHGMTYQAFADFMGAGYTTVWKWINVYIPIRRLEQVSDKLKIKCIICID